MATSRGAGLGGAAYGGDAGGGGARTCGGSGAEGADAVNVPLERHNLRVSATIATGLGPDWSEEMGFVRAGLERPEGADIRRAGLIRASGQECVAESEWYADASRASDRDNGIFQVTARTLLKGRDGSRQSPITRNGSHNYI